MADTLTLIESYRHQNHFIGQNKDSKTLFDNDNGLISAFQYRHRFTIAFAHSNLKPLFYPELGSTRSAPPAAVPAEIGDTARSKESAAPTLRGTCSASPSKLANNYRKEEILTNR
jgi:hypothetical protein